MLDGEDVTQLASMVKLKSGRLSREVTDKCLQYWGGMGFTNEVSTMFSTLILVKNIKKAFSWINL